jgi:hypothetical protein
MEKWSMSSTQPQPTTGLEHALLPLVFLSSSGSYFPVVTLPYLSLASPQALSPFDL